MPRSTSGAQDTLFSSKASGLVALMDFAFSSGTLYYTTNTVPVPALGRTYLSLPILSVSQVRESEVLSRDKLDINLPITDQAMLSYTMGSASVYRGRDMKLYMQPIDSGYSPVGDPHLFFTGTMENFEIDRPTTKDGKTFGTITLRCHRKGISRFRNQAPAYLTHAQQILDYPGDLGLEYTENLVKNPPVWLSRAFQEDGV